MNGVKLKSCIIVDIRSSLNIRSAYCTGIWNCRCNKCIFRVLWHHRFFTMLSKLRMRLARLNATKRSSRLSFSFSVGERRNYERHFSVVTLIRVHGVVCVLNAEWGVGNPPNASVHWMCNCTDKRITHLLSAYKSIFFSSVDCWGTTVNICYFHKWHICASPLSDS